MTPQTILQFCFPDGLDQDLQIHLAFWERMMRGGIDQEITERFQDMPERAFRGEFDSWSETASGRLALILVLDQFPRSIYRATAKSYAFDQMALELCQDGIDRGHFLDVGTPWGRTLFAMPLVHAEGPTLRLRAKENVKLAEETLALAPGPLKPAYEFCVAQSRRHQKVIDEFGRHPHRNAMLGRASTPEEEAYLTNGDFPHEQKIRV